MTAREEVKTTVAQQHKRSGAKAGRAKSKKAAARPSAPAKARSRAATPAAPARGSAATARPAAAGARPSGPSALERAQALRDAVQRSKLTASDPWGYAAKARGWAKRALQIVDQLEHGRGSAATQQALDTLAAEVERDRDFQEARRLF